MSEPDHVKQSIRYEPVYQRLVVPLRPHVAAEVFVPRPMSEADWEQFLNVLATMKPSLVAYPIWADHGLLDETP